MLWSRRPSVTFRASNTPSGPRPCCLAHAIPDGIRIRPGTARDTNQIAAVCAEAFGQGNFPDVDNPQIAELEQRYAAAIDREIRQKVQQAMDRKAQAASEHREYRLLRSTMLMRAQLAVLQGLPAVFPVQPSPDERRAEVKWMRSRKYLCLVAQDPVTGLLVGTVTLSLSQPEALLPPPFPSLAPTRLYVSNMAVRERWRRKGVARGLLHACVRTAALWGHNSLWLHVRNTKVGALRLYTREGFSRPAPSSPLPTFLSLTGEVLLQRQVAVRAGSTCQGPREQQAALRQQKEQAVVQAAWGRRQPRDHKIRPLT